VFFVPSGVLDDALHFFTNVKQDFYTTNFGRGSKNVGSWPVREEKKIKYLGIEGDLNA
jgi:hypothetical protein